MTTTIRALVLLSLTLACAAAARAQGPPEPPAESPAESLADRAANPAAAAPASPRERINAGTALHDQGRYDEAIAIYRAVLKDDPGNERARYEIVYSLSAKGDYTACVTAAEQAFKGAKLYRPQLWSVEGNCLDLAGKGGQAARVYARGRREFPHDAGLAYNFAVAEAGRGRSKAARELFKVALVNDPRHPSAHLGLARAYLNDGYPVPALLTAFRFLALEPTGRRAEAAAGIARDLMTRGARKTETGVTITFDPKAPRDEGDWSPFELLLGLSAANRIEEQATGKPDLDLLATDVATLLSGLDETPVGRRKPSFVEAQLRPFFREIHQAKLGEAFGHFAFAPLHLPGEDTWRTEHRDEAERLEALLARLNQR